MVFENVRGQSLGVVRNHNLKTVLRLLYKQPYSCFEMAKIMKISAAAVRKNILALLSAGVIRVAEEDESRPKSRGGQHVRYCLCENDDIFMCLDMSNYGDKEIATCRIYSMAGNLLATKTFPMSQLISGEEIAAIIAGIKQLIAENGLNGKHIIKINVSVPGQINRKTGYFILSSRFENSEEVNLSRIFAQAFDSDVRVMNDTQYAALGSAANGEFEDKSYVYYVYVGAIGIGSAIFSDGNIWEGGDGFTGEIGILFCSFISFLVKVHAKFMNLQSNLCRIYSRFSSFM